MPKSHSSLKKLEKKISADFEVILSKLGPYLDRPVPASTKSFVIQDPSSSDDIPAFGKIFGVISKNTSIVLAHWLIDLPPREKNAITQFLLIKEAFKAFLYSIFPESDRYSELLEILLNLTATLWFIEENSIPILHHHAVANIRSRFVFKDTDDFSYLKWDHYLTLANDCSLSAKILFAQLLSQLKLALDQKLPLKSLIANFEAWFDTHAIESTDLALPIEMKSRYNDIVKLLLKFGYQDGTAKNVGEKLALQHDVINTAFKEMADDLVIFWRPQINYMMLRIYPYVFRVTLTDKKHREFFVKELKKIKYINSLLEDSSTDECLFYSLIYCPHIVHNQFQELFEKLSKSNIIKDYFFLMVKHRINKWSITDVHITSSEDSYAYLFKQPESFKLHTYEVFNEKYALSEMPQTKQAFFDETVLAFLSVLRGRHLTKGSYGVYVTELYDLCNKNDVDIKNSVKVTGFINQLDIRCRRLKILDYYLMAWKKTPHSGSLYFELLIDPEDQEIIEYVSRLEVFGAMTKMVFYDRILLFFIGMGYDHPFRSFVEKKLQEKNIDYFAYAPQAVEDFKKCPNLHHLYDFKENKWTY
ncbi:MAG: hypothetical protein ACTSO7_03515 [Candidatus Heimdallarchaeota archaeon]